MFLKNINIQKLAALLEPHMGKPAWPGLMDPAVKERARAFAKESGLWDKITAELDPTRDIPVMKRSDFRDYARTGSRTKDEQARAYRANETNLAGLALWLDHPSADLDYFQDLLWAWCETTWWHLVAEEGRHIDLLSSLRARELAEYSHIFADRLEPEVRERISAAVSARVLDIVLDYKKLDWWQTHKNNWNTVCNGNIIQAALYEIKDPMQLAALLHPVCRRMEYAIDYYTNDGGCVEGAGYWGYGFGNFVDAALALYHRTGGAVNLMEGEHIARICHFPLSVYLRPPVRASFADSSDEWLTAALALKINQFMPLPELFQLVNKTDRGTLELEDIRSLALFNGEKPLPYTDRTDYLLPDLGYAKVHAVESDVILAAVAGRNDVSHNHNDLGSFLILKDGIMFLTDPGAPHYTAKTFSERRYETLVCASTGHSVPLINGLEQLEGDFFGTISAGGLNTVGDKVVTIDLAHAYPDPTLRKFLRQFVLGKDGSVRMVDQFEFSKVPVSLEEAFVSFEPIEVQGHALKIGTGTATVGITSKVPGTFHVDCFTKAQHEGFNPRVLYRARFLPDMLDATIQLEFTIG